MDAAIGFIVTHPGQIGLVTVSIGGNDVTHCATVPAVDTVACVLAAKGSIAGNVGALVTELDSDLTSYLDTTAHIVGITYPDVILGDWVAPVGSVASCSRWALA